MTTNTDTMNTPGTPHSRAAEAITSAWRDQRDSLDLHGLGLKTLPPLPAGWALRRLNLAGNRLQLLPPSLWQLTGLVELDLGGNRLRELDAGIGRLAALQALDLSENRLTGLPDALAGCTALATLDLCDNALDALPAVLLALPALRVLDLSRNRLSALPDLRGHWPTLESLDLAGNRLVALPLGVDALPALRRLDLSRNQFSSIDALAALPALQVLFVDHNQLSALPPGLADGGRLQQLSARGNPLTIAVPRAHLALRERVLGGPEPGRRYFDAPEFRFDFALALRSAPAVSGLLDLYYKSYPGMPVWLSLPDGSRAELAQLGRKAALDIARTSAGGEAPHPTLQFERTNNASDVERGCDFAESALERLPDVALVPPRDRIAGWARAMPPDAAPPDAAPPDLFDLAPSAPEPGGAAEPTPATPSPADAGAPEASPLDATFGLSPPPSLRPPPPPAPALPSTVPPPPPPSPQTPQTTQTPQTPPPMPQMPAAAAGDGRAALPPAGEAVDAAVYCPPRVARDSVFLVQVFLYPPAASAEVEAEAQQRDPTAAQLGSHSLPLDVPRGTRIDLRLEMPTLSVDEADAVLVWRGVPTAAQFEVGVPAGAAAPNAIGRVRFAIAGVPAGTLRFQVLLAAAGTAPEPAQPRPSQGVRYRRAFVSYSSNDRAEVLRRVQAFKIAGIAVFQDILDLDPGQRWERELYREIDHCDVLLLFWSRAAAASEWIGKELDYAIARQHGNRDNPPAIQPVPIEGPPIVPPPARLGYLHFNDALLAQIAMAAAPAPPTGPAG